MISAVVRGLIEGIVRPLVEAWQQYLHGRTAQQKDDLAATLKMEREIADALAKNRASRKPLTWDDVLRDDGEPPAADNGRPSAGTHG